MDHGVDALGEVPPVLGHRARRAMRAWDAGEASVVAEGVLQLERHRHEAVVEPAVAVLLVVLGGHRRAVEQAVAAVQAVAKDAGRVGVHVDVVDAEAGRLELPRAIAADVLQDRGDARHVEEVAEALAPVERAAVTLAAIQLAADGLLAGVGDGE